MTIDQEAFKGGMRRLAAGVCVITTTRPDGTRAGLTATAVCSVSADPPTLLVCINSGSATYEAIRSAQTFAVNLLSIEDSPIAARFASPMAPEERFAAGLWLRLETGAPVLESALAAFDCRLSRVVSVGTHGIMFGEIHAVRLREPHVKPLLYAHGAYGGFASVDACRDPQTLSIPSW